MAALDFQMADYLLKLSDDLRSGCYEPAPYHHFFIHEPKRRKISAAHFLDRVVHHALCSIIEPRFEQRFIEHSYANRAGKGSHRAIEQFQHFARRNRYVLRLDIRQHFAAIDHEILYRILAKQITEDDINILIRKILKSGQGVLDEQYQMTWFEGDDLLSACRPRGLPIGNLTSQFWSNCYLHPFDQFVQRELRCDAYLRYVDDFALFSDSKNKLWSWKKAIIQRLERYRLKIHEHSAQVVPVSSGSPWLGFVIFPNHKKLKARKLRYTHKRLKRRYNDYLSQQISFAEFDACIKGWIAHAAHADSWGLRQHVLKDFIW